MIAVAACHGRNEDGDVSEEQDVMGMMRVNNQEVPQMHTVQGGAGRRSGE